MPRRASPPAASAPVPESPEPPASPPSPSSPPGAPAPLPEHAHVITTAKRRARCIETSRHKHRRKPSRRRAIKQHRATCPRGGSCSCATSARSRRQWSAAESKDRTTVLALTALALKYSAYAHTLRHDLGSIMSWPLQIVTSPPIRISSATARRPSSRWRGLPPACSRSPSG